MKLNHYSYILFYFRNVILIIIHIYLFIIITYIYMPIYSIYIFCQSLNRGMRLIGNIIITIQFYLNTLLAVANSVDFYFDVDL